MDTSDKKWAIVIIGPPGSGKDTQAELLAHELKFVEIKSSKIIEDKFKSADPNDEVMNREKELNASGQLNTAELVDEWLVEKIEGVAKTGTGLIANGWPRGAHEAEKEIPVLEKYYSKESIKVIVISLSEQTSIHRNSKRRVCEKNGHPILDTPKYKGVEVCPEDGSPIVSRADDVPEVIARRYQVYLDQTKPVIDFFNEKGYNIITINGEQPIESVHRDILDKLW